MTLSISGIEDWYCPNCHFEQSIPAVPQPHTRMHPCRSMMGFISPMVRKGTRAKVEMRLWEDYEGAERTQRNADGRPVMSMVTTRDDGQDCAVYAPTATLSASARMKE